MNTAVLVLLGLTAVLGLLLTVQGERVRPPWAALFLAVLLALAGVLAWAGGDAPAGTVEAGRTQAEAAGELGISRQAVGQRLAAGLWDLERDLRPTATRLLARAAGDPT